MKKWLLILASLALGLSMAACNQRNNRADNLIASGINSPGILNANCLNNGFNGFNVYSPFPTTYPGQSACGAYNFGAGGIFSNYPYNGSYYNGYRNGFHGGFNQCPVGSVATYNPYLGLSCLPVSAISGLGYDFAYWGWDYLSFEFSYYGGIGSGFGGIGTPGAFNSCWVGSPLSCGIGTCIPISGAIGICAL